MLKRRAFNASIWSAADAISRQGFQLLVTIVLAHLLSPEEFGTIALLTFFIAISAVFVDSGFSSALIQKQDADHAEESTVFWFNLGVGLLATVLLWFAAPFIAAFYEKPALTPIIHALSFVIAINATGAIHVALLTKRLDFLTQMKIGAIANLVSGAIAITLAWKGFGVWSLVAQILVSTLLGNALLWLFNSWRPALGFQFILAKRLFSFGGYMVAATLLDTIYSKGYSLLIGKFYSTHELGLYNQAENTKQLPVATLSGIILRVSFPMLSSIAGDKANLRRGTQLAIRSVMFINIPMMLGLATIAPVFVELVFGKQWLATAPILQVLCLAGILWPLHAINVNVLLAQGHSKLAFNLQVIKSILGIFLLFAGSRYGIMGIAWSQVVLSAVCFLLNTHYTKVHLDYGALKQLLDNLPALLVSIPMVLLVHLMGIYWQAAPALKMPALVVAGTLAFFAATYLTKPAAFTDMLGLLNKQKPASVEATTGPSA